MNHLNTEIFCATKNQGELKTIINARELITLSCENGKKYALIEVKGNGNCLFRSLSYGLYEDEQCHRDIRLIMVIYVKDI